MPACLDELGKTCPPKCLSLGYCRLTRTCCAAGPSNMYRANHCKATTSLHRALRLIPCKSCGHLWYMPVTSAPLTKPKAISSQAPGTRHACCIRLAAFYWLQLAAIHLLLEETLFARCTLHPWWWRAPFGAASSLPSSDSGPLSTLSISSSEPIITSLRRLEMDIASSSSPCRQFAPSATQATSQSPMPCCHVGTSR